MKSVDYIPVIKNNYEMWSRINVPYYIAAPKIPINEIIIDKKFVPNPLCEETVQTISNYFYEWNWYPIIIDENYFLRDGQHRIEFARRKGLRYIDAIIQHSVLLEAIEGKNAQKRSDCKNRRTRRR